MTKRRTASCILADVIIVRRNLAGFLALVLWSGYAQGQQVVQQSTAGQVAAAQINAEKTPQQTTEPKKKAKPRLFTHVAALDIGTVPFGNLGVRYERAILPWLAVTLPVDVKTIHLNAVGIFDKIRGFQSLVPLLLITAGSGVKFRMGGWFIEPFVKVGYAQIQSSVNALQTAHAGVIEPGIFAGYQWTPKSGKPGFFVDIGPGVTTRFHIYPTPENVKKPFHDPLLGKPDFRLSFGYTW